MSRITIPTALILQAIENGFAFGFDIMRVTGLPSGTVYPALRRLENEGLVASRWEAEDRAHAEGRPARKDYEITPRGRRRLAQRVENDVVVRGALDVVPKKQEPERDLLVGEDAS